MLIMLVSQQMPWLVIQEVAPPKGDTAGEAYLMEAFGSGRRMCPGNRVATRIFQFTLARFLHSFDWSLPDEQDPTTLDMSDTLQFNLKKAEPLLVVPHARLPHHLY
jgi:cytochrome P450